MAKKWENVTEAHKATKEEALKGLLSAILDYDTTEVPGEGRWYNKIRPYANRLRELENLERGWIMSATNEEIKKAVELGRAAFLAGRRPAAGEDRNLMELRGNAHNENREAWLRSMAIMRAWKRGWNQAKEGY